MCGIWGIIGTKTDRIGASQQRFLAAAALAGMVRGVDGTGLIMQGLSGEVKTGTTTAQGGKKRPTSWTTYTGPMETTYYKSAACGPDFAAEFNLRSLNSGITSVIGHNRAATSGEITAETAHPFNAGGVCGVHNGTLESGWQGRLEVAAKCPVDSLGLYRAIAARGAEWAIGKACGAMALVWVDVDSGDTFIYRNDERPLSWATDKEGRLYIASESGMLDWLMARSGIKCEEVGDFFPKRLYRVPQGTSTLEVVKEYVKETSLYIEREDWNRATTKYVNALPRGHNPTSNTFAGIDDGIPFRGTSHLTKTQRDAGFVGEWVERGDTVWTCDCCGKDIDGDYVQDVKTNEVWHTHCHSAVTGDIGKGYYHILRKCDKKHKRAARQAA